MTEPTKNAIMTLIFGLLTGALMWQGTDVMKNANEVPALKISVEQLKDTVRDHEFRIRDLERK